jgi:poly-beta-1,6-N-acetyl-D-glucosamine synthase
MIYILFWISLFIVFYTFVGYGIVLYGIVKIKRLLNPRKQILYSEPELPSLTLVVAVFNEAYILADKIKNTLALQYPAEKLHIIFVTDGSTDESPEIVKKYPSIQLMHSAARNGKIAAVHRAMQQVNTEIVVFTDANTFLNKEALVFIASHYKDATVGAVSGEKRVYSTTNDATAGEGIYWKYESALKKWDAELYSVVGAAGELFSVRVSLYEAVPADTVLDDFMISLKIAAKGYRIVYEPAAYAMETSSVNIAEELKRKIRIAAGGIQSIIRLGELMNPFKHPVLSFQYISHRVLRWTVTPFLLMLVFALNIWLVVQGASWFYTILLVGQVGFYTAAILGWLLEQRNIKVKVLFIPYYFCMMNYAVLAGIIRYFGKKQSAAWEKSKRQIA